MIGMDHPLQAMEERLKPGLRLRVWMAEHQEVTLYGCSIFNTLGESIQGSAIALSPLHSGKEAWRGIEREMMTALPELFTESWTDVLD